MNTEQDLSELKVWQLELTDRKNFITGLYGVIFHIDNIEVIDDSWYNNPLGFWENFKLQSNPVEIQTLAGATSYSGIAYFKKQKEAGRLFEELRNRLMKYVRYYSPNHVFSSEEG
jgi:hypothetical protein